MVERPLHPIVAQMTPSDEQRPAVTARGHDVAVTAGAGAGKTRTLVARYLSLLADEIPLRAIVAITFTKKAAREMRNRVRQEIRRYLEREELPEAERRRWRDHYEQLDGARIGTIHSLCGEILRRHPAAVGIDPRFEMLEEGQMALLQAQSVEAALGWAADERQTAADLIPLFESFGEGSLKTLVASLLQQRLDVADAQRAVPQPDDLERQTVEASAAWSLWEPVLVAPLRAFVEDPGVREGFAVLQNLRADGTLARAHAAGDALAPDLTTALAHIDATIAAHEAGDWAAISRHLAPLREALKLKGRQANWAPATPKATIGSLRERYDATLADLVKQGIDLDLDRQLAVELLPALLQIYERAADHYRGAKQQRRTLDFDDLEALALHLLETDAEVRATWQHEIRALLVDEFQDTNGRQRDMLRVLNGEGRRLYIVGDGKQSIYRFRGADVTVFRAERRAIEVDGTGVQLVTSYRAHRGLAEGLNALLRPVLGEEEDLQRPYVEPFAALIPYRDAAADGLQPPYVELHLALGTRSGGALDRAAAALAARLAALVEGRHVILEGHDEETGVSARSRASDLRPLSYGDIAILCRASASFPAYENALEAAGIPYLTIAGRGFYDRPEVRDVLNALSALADPTDDLALAGLLRSPAVGLTDMALVHLREAQRAQELPSLWAMLQRTDLDLPADEGARAREAAALIRELNRMVGRTAVADVLKDFLDRTSYRAILLRAGETRAANNVSKLLADAHTSGIVSVDVFVAYLAELRDVAPREGEARALTAGAVQIMSVHQAKGLEFAVVVLGDAARANPGSRGLLIDPGEARTGMGILPPTTASRVSWAADGSRQVEQVASLAYRLAQRREQDRADAESDRLLYVAATRARELLIVSSTLGVSARGTLSVTGWLAQLELALQMTASAPACDPDGSTVHMFSLGLDEIVVQCTLYEPAAPLPSGAVRQEPLPALALPEDLRLLERVDGLEAQVDDAVREAERDPPRRVWRVVPQARRAWAPAWVVGELVHQALAAWSFPEDGRGIFTRRAAAAARNAGLTDEARIANAVQRAARMLLRFRGTELYTAMASAPQRLLEVPYSVLDAEGRLNAGVIDALWCADGQWHLVEFKTDRIRDETALAEHLRESDYVAQVARYVAAAAQVLGQRPDPMLCLLNVGGRVRLVMDRWANDAG